MGYPCRYLFALYSVFHFYFVYFITGTADKESLEGCHGQRYLYIFVVLFLIIYGVCFIMRRALAFGARVRGLDHCAMCTAQRLWRAVGPFELYEHLWRTCLAGTADRVEITPDPVYMCTLWMHRKCQLS